jgi:Holliday junction resolvasome RuvABC DNA-binding subunit
MRWSKTYDKMSDDESDTSSLDIQALEEPKNKFQLLISKIRSSNDFKKDLKKTQKNARKILVELQNKKDRSEEEETALKAAKEALKSEKVVNDQHMKLTTAKQEAENEFGLLSKNLEEEAELFMSWAKHQDVHANRFITHVETELPIRLKHKFIFLICVLLTNVVNKDEAKQIVGANTWPKKGNMKLLVELKNRYFKTYTIDYTGIKEPARPQTPLSFTTCKKCGGPHWTLACEVEKTYEEPQLELQELKEEAAPPLPVLVSPLCGRIVNKKVPEGKAETKKILLEMISHYQTSLIEAYDLLKRLDATQREDQVS